MAFCNALASQGQVFNFSISVGRNFSFSLDTRSKAIKDPTVTKKKASPSTLRRNAKRREEFYKKQPTSSASNAGDGAAGFFTCPPLHPLASCTVQLIKWLMTCPSSFQSDTNFIPEAEDHMTISHTTPACW